MISRIRSYQATGATDQGRWRTEGNAAHVAPAAVRARGCNKSCKGLKSSTGGASRRETVLGEVWAQAYRNKARPDV